MAEFKVRHWDYSEPNNVPTEVVVKADSFFMLQDAAVFCKRVVEVDFTYETHVAAYTNVISVREIETDG